MGRLVRFVFDLLSFIVYMTAWLVGGAYLFWQMLVVGVNDGLHSFLVVMVAGAPTLYALLILHELGHLLVGHLTGLPFERITLGPLIVRRDEGRLKVSLNAAWFKPATFVAYNGDSPVAAWKVLLTILAGPATNLALGAACFAMAEWVNPGPPETMNADARAGWRSVAVLFPGDGLTAWFNCTGLVSTALGLLFLMPGTAVGVRNDGGLVADLLTRRGEFAEQLPSTTPAVEPDGSNSAEPHQ